MSLVMAFAGQAAADCPPVWNGQVQQAAQLRAWGQDAALPPAQFQRVAFALADCLSSPDPALRDELGFELLSAWMRAGRLTPQTLRLLSDRWLAVLKAPPDEAGFHAPFAALALSEVARVDRVQPYLQPPERDALLGAAAAWLRQWRDYRAHDDREGWRHGVAHGADLLMQLALNPAMDPEGAALALASLGAQVLAQGQVAYQHGEGERLARAARCALGRSAWSGAQVQAWLQAVLLPARGSTWDERRLRQVHNARQFLWPLYVGLQEQPDAGLRERALPAVRQALASLD
ncbi:DUF2785 domain-containing protein [Mitsuaria sp. WAJ17]|uniref:DUF2785 domain-containing protein n=1 Tax=Mitsuaria sp. WAJ17 TaxID=2761452 RepID=UPI0016002530|nr:DUF2785 domain-containing protein [Mitsuaria sp. WAJ17]MBB2488023.1 DUF2785 domain-containing protein [Mitsuaria sp. WAJ17]